MEGPLDAIAVTTAGRGRYAGVAPCGTALTAQQAAALGHAADLRATGVLVAFDADQAGQRAAVKAYHLLSPLTGAATAVILPAGQDPAQILADQGPAALARLLGGHTAAAGRPGHRRRSRPLEPVAAATPKGRSTRCAPPPP